MRSSVGCVASLRNASGSARCERFKLQTRFEAFVQKITRGKVSSKVRLVIDRGESRRAAVTVHLSTRLVWHDRAWVRLDRARRYRTTPGQLSEAVEHLRFSSFFSPVESISCESRLSRSQSSLALA